MKITFERALLIVILCLLIFNGFCNRDGSAEKLLIAQNKQLTVEIDSVKKEIKLLGDKLEKLKQDTVTIIKNYTQNVVEANNLIREDSSNANRIIRRQLDEAKQAVEKYSAGPLTNEELANVSFRLIDYDKLKLMLNNYKNREGIYEMKLIGKDEIIKLQQQQIKNLEQLVDEVRPAWYNNFYFGATAATLVGLGIMVLVK